MWKLANLLFQEGDIKRAYTYIECSMQDATFCNARYRTQEISELLPVISWTYENKLREEKTQMVALVDVYKRQDGMRSQRIFTFGLNMTL